MKKIAAILAVVMIISSCGSALNGTYADMATENEIPGSIYQYVFVKDGSFTFTWKVPGVESEEEYDIDIVLRGNYSIKEDILSFTITEETTKVMGQSPEAKVPWSVDMQILSKSRDEIEISRLAEDSDDGQSYRNIKLSRR